MVQNGHFWQNYGPFQKIKYYYYNTLSLFSGSTSIMPRNRFWQSGGTKWGMWKLPLLTFSRSCLRLSSSNGNAPTKRAYRITPQDHTSALRPSYFSPCKLIWRNFKVRVNFSFIYIDTLCEWLKISFLPLSLQDKHSVGIHSLFLALTPWVGVMPYQNLQFWCYSCHQVIDFLVSNLYDWKRINHTL